MDHKQIREIIQNRSSDNSPFRNGYESDVLRFSGTRKIFSRFFLNAFVQYRIAEKNLRDVTDLKSFIAGAELPPCIESILKNHSEELLAEFLLRKPSQEDWAAILFDGNLSRGVDIEHSFTPPGIIELARRLLDIQDEDHVLDLCSGSGSFILNSWAATPRASYTGVDLNKDAVDSGILRTWPLEGNISFVQENALSFHSPLPFEKVFANYPLLTTGPENAELQEKLKKEWAEKLNIPETELQRTSWDWFFNLAVIQAMAPRGKAVVVMRAGSAWNSQDEAIRRDFIKQGLIEKVIQLPRNCLPSTSVECMMVVFSRNPENTKSITLLDARPYSSPSQGWQKVLTNEKIEEILKAMESGNKDAVRIMPEEALQLNSALDAERYATQVAFEKTFVLGDITEKIRRGPKISIAELNSLGTDEDSKSVFIANGDLGDGIVDASKSGKHLTNMPDNKQAYCVSDETIIISRVANPKFKSSLLRVPEGYQVFISENLFALELKKENVDPYYVQAFLDSETGNKMVSSLCSGSGVSIISMEMLKKLQIPQKPLEEQKMIAEKYRTAVKRVSELKSQLEAALFEQTHVWGNS